MQKETGLVAMVGHTRRFNPSHQWVHNKVTAGELQIQQMDVQTYFFRRTNTNALGEPRSWTDHLLWHHAAHTVDLFAYQAGSPIVQAHAVQGPDHPQLGIAMDMSIQLKAESGAICTLSLSFNNDGPLGTFFRYIGDTGTYIARYDDLVTGKEEPIDVIRRGRVDERHRAAGPRVCRGDPRRSRTELVDRAGLAVLPHPRRLGAPAQGQRLTPQSSSESLNRSVGHVLTWLTLLSSEQTPAHRWPVQPKAAAPEWVRLPLRSCGWQLVSSWRRRGEVREPLHLRVAVDADAVAAHVHAATLRA